MESEGMVETGSGMRRVLLHGGLDDRFDDSVALARRLAEGAGAELHVVYTVEDPLSAGWTAEMSADRLPELHQAMEAEARARLSRLIPAEEQDTLGITFAIRTGPAAEELVRYTEENTIDLAVVQVKTGASPDLARALLDHGRCAVLVLRGR